MSEPVRPNPRRKPGAILGSAGRETLLYDPVADVVHVLNPTALLVWELCDGQHTPAQIETELHARFDTTAAPDVARDVKEVLALFEREGLVFGRPPGSIAES